MTEQTNLSRRRFLTRLTKPAEQLIHSTSSPTPRAAVRPPRALDEALFVELCTGCGACQLACTESVIEIANTVATLNLDYNHCTLCDYCTVACTTGALNQTQSMQIDFYPIFCDNCQNYLMDTCNLCQDSCPQQAIFIEADELPIVNTEKCNGCGACRAACSVGSIIFTASHTC